MTAERMEFLDRQIVIDPAICIGNPTIRGKRITVQTFLEFLAAGHSEVELLEQYSSLNEKDIHACLRFPTRLTP